MLHRLLLVLLLNGIVLASRAQLQLQVNGEPVDNLAASVQLQLQPAMDFSDSAFRQMMQQHWEPLTPAAQSKGLYDNSVWFRIDLSGFSQKDLELVEIANPHINFIRCWLLNGDSLIRDYPLTGDHLPYATRAMPLSDFAFKLPPIAGSGKPALILALDKARSKLYMPVHFYSTAYFAKEKERSGISNGILIGILLLLFVANLVLFSSLKQWAFGWYSLYLLVIILYTLCDYGLLFEYGYPDSPGLNDLLRPALLAISIVPSLLFYRNLLKLHKTLPVHDRILRWSLGVFLLLYVAAFSMLTSDNYPLQEFWLRIYSILSPGILLYFLFISLLATVKRVQLAVYAAVSFICIFLFILLYTLAQNDVLPYTYLLRNAQYSGILGDAAIMLVALIARFRLFKKQSDQLRHEYYRQQDHIFREMAEWQHHEMQKTATYLHDTIGTSLGLIRMETDYMELTEANRVRLAEKIRQLGNDIRTMSHSFSAELLEKKGVRQFLEEQVFQINSRGELHIQLEWIETEESIGFHYQIIIFRIVQELLQNLMKHARASQANLQIMIRKKFVYIYMEDNGVGAGELKNGIGLKNIEQLVQLLGGSCSIRTAPGSGFAVSMEFKQSDYEINEDGNS